MHIELYVRLGFEDNTPTAKEISQAYRSKAKDCHPDQFPGDKVKEALFIALTEAYEILKDPDKRAEYDNSGFILSNNEERAMRNMAINNLMNSYMQAIDQIGEAQIDVMDVKELLVRNIDRNKQNLAQEIAKRETTIRKVNRSLSKFKHKGSDESILHKATLKVIEAKKTEILEINKACRILDIMDDIINNYDYETISAMQEPNFNNSMMRGFAVRTFTV